MRKVLELSGKAEILSFFGVILLFNSILPYFFGYYFMAFEPRLFLELYIALILSRGKQFIDNLIILSEA